MAIILTVTGSVLSAALVMIAGYGWAGGRNLIEPTLHVELTGQLANATDEITLEQSPDGKGVNPLKIAFFWFRN